MQFRAPLLRAGSGRVAMTIDEYLSFFEKRLSAVVETGSYGLQESRRSTRGITELLYRQKNEIVDGNIKEFRCKISDGILETSGVEAELVEARFRTTDAKTKGFEQIAELPQFNNEAAEQLK